MSAFKILTWSCTTVDAEDYESVDKELNSLISECVGYEFHDIKIVALDYELFYTIVMKKVS